MSLLRVYTEAIQSDDVKTIKQVIDMMPASQVPSLYCSRIDSDEDVNVLERLIIDNQFRHVSLRLVSASCASRLQTLLTQVTKIDHLKIIISTEALIYWMDCIPFMTNLLENHQTLRVLHVEGNFTHHDISYMLNVFGTCTKRITVQQIQITALDVITNVNQFAQVRDVTIVSSTSVKLDYRTQEQREEPIELMNIFASLVMGSLSIACFHFVVETVKNVLY